MDYQRKYLKYKTKYLELKANVKGGSKYIAFIDNVKKNPLAGKQYENFYDENPKKGIKVDFGNNASQIRSIQYNDKKINYVLLKNESGELPSLSELMMDFVFNIVYDKKEKQEKYNLILNEELKRTTDDKLVEVLDILVRFLNYAYTKDYTKDYYNTFLKNLLERLIKYSEISKKNIFTTFINNLIEYRKKSQIEFMTNYLKEIIGNDNYKKITETLTDIKL